MIERELSEVKYSVRRSLCMEAGDQLGKHWAKVRYEDLADIQLSKEKMDSLKAIFGSMYIADLDQHITYLRQESPHSSILDTVSDKYDSIKDFLINEMIETEEKITPRKLNKLANMYQIDVDILKQTLPIAEQELYQRLQEYIDIQDT